MASTSDLTAFRRAYTPLVKRCDELEKKLKGIERSLEKVSADEVALHEQMAKSDQGDYEGLAKLAELQAELNLKRDGLELDWLETTEKLG